jgi:hypothetical protein
MGGTSYYVLCFQAECICTQLGSTKDGTTTLRHTGHVTTHYMTCHLFDLYLSNLEGSRKLPDDGRLLPKHVEASIQNKGVVQISA